MRLGNHGWGMRELIIYMCVLAIILLFVAISIHSLYRRIDHDNNNRETPAPVVVPEEDKREEPVIIEPEEPAREVNYTYYAGEENRLKAATQRYLEEKPTDIGEGILKIELDSLVNLGYMSPIYNDVGTEKCTGYSNVYVQEGSSIYTIYSYIRCDNYSSEGF